MLVKSNQCLVIGLDRETRLVLRELCNFPLSSPISILPGGRYGAAAIRLFMRDRILIPETLEVAANGRPVSPDG
jgi:hypothetical protein